MLLIQAGQADAIRRKDGTALPVSYLVIPTEVSGRPCYVGLVWPRETTDSG